MPSRDHFVALTHRNFRLIWLGLLASLTGSMMQNAALLWHVSLLVSPERKALALGLVGLVRVVPIVVFSMFSGVVADAWNRRRLMLLTQTGAALVSLALAVLTFRGVTLVWPIYVLAALGAAVGTFDLPARQALVPTLVPREHLPNAISLNAIMFQAASVVGPVARRHRHRGGRRRLGVRRQRAVVRLRHRGAADDARRQRPPVREAHDARATRCRCAPPGRA